MKRFIDTDPKQEAYAMGYRKIILVDFDGVLHLYGSGWKGPNIIADGPVPGAIAWLEAIVGHQDKEGRYLFDVQIYSSRSKYPEGVEAMRLWLGTHGLRLETLAQISFPTEKTPAWLTVDDRCFRFEGMFPTIEWMLRFESWTKQMPMAPSDAEFLRGLAALERNEDGEGVELDAEQCRRLHGIADWMEGIDRAPVPK